MDIDSRFQHLVKSLIISVVRSFSLFLLINSPFVNRLRCGNWQGHKAAIKSISYINSCKSFLEDKG